MDPAVGELPQRRLIVGLAAFNALSALAGGLELLAVREGSERIPVALLAHTPFRSFLIPGLLLAFVIGGSSLLCAILVQRRARAAVEATISREARSRSGCSPSSR